MSKKNDQMLAALLAQMKDVTGVDLLGDYQSTPKKSSRLQELRKRAAKIGISIEAEKDDEGWGYWLVDVETNDTPWDDENFSTSHDELEDKIGKLERERV